VPKPRNESFVRWQRITITQLGYAVNLILGFATASLGFALTLLKDKDFTPQHCEKFFFDLSLALLLLSIAFGVWCVINRLRDFRKTKDIANEREELDETELTRRRNEVDKLGRCTWRLFLSQLVSFSVGLLALILVFLLISRAKLL
jgi:4-hydroxybenzoate polyprenyltransferase